MKILLLVYILFGLFQQNICSAQNTFPTLADHPKWRVREYIVYRFTPKYFIDYALEKDTLINDLNYSIVIRSDSSYNLPKSYRIGYTRTSGEKVYFKFIDGMEYMIYDFGLKVGESCYCYMCGIGLDKYTALNVDTITIDGIKRKRIQVYAESLSGFPSYWIEGIGSNLNPFLYYCSGVKDELRCLTTNSGTIYMNPDYTDCESLYQITHTIVNVNTQWSGLNVKFTNTAADSLFSYSIRFEGDTICNYIPYTKIWQSSDSLAEHWKLYGSIREEYKKTWFLPLGEVEEHLLYDFSVTPEQTVLVTNPSGFGIQMKVTSVDSIEVYGVKRLRIQLKGLYNDTNTDTWIEKIGSIHGILSSCYDIPGWKNNVLCVKENDQQIFRNETYPNCFYDQNSLTNNEQVHFQNKIEIYPNPASDQLFIDTRSEGQAKLQIRFFTTNGSIVFDKVVSGYHNTIDISMIPSGLYFIQVRTENSIMNKKVIIR
jgi:hypothetical protein